ncbi:MAG: hypothetical protein R3Y09_03695 [Clostridia bacterium]
MLILTSTSFLLMIVGIFILLKMTPFEFSENLVQLCKIEKSTMKSKISGAKEKKKIKGLKLLFLEVREILKITNKENMFYKLCTISVILFVLGAYISIFINNIYLVPIMAVGFSLLPFYYVKFTASRYKKQINLELETALSIITTSYMRGNSSIINAIEENIDYLNSPIRNVFENFLFRITFCESNIKTSLENMKLGIDNVIFQEWVSELISCQDDHNFKATLPRIVEKLSDTRIITGRLDLFLYEPIKEYVTMVALVVGSIPIMYFLNKDWYNTLMNTEFGKILLAISSVVIFVSVGAVVRHTRPIEYKR